MTVKDFNPFQRLQSTHESRSGDRLSNLPQFRKTNDQAGSKEASRPSRKSSFKLSVGATSPRRESLAASNLLSTWGLGTFLTSPESSTAQPTGSAYICPNDRQLSLRAK